MGGSNLTSATGIISALDDEQPEIKEFALQKLNEIVNEFWAEISASISKIEILYEDETFKARQLAALVASKVYFHLEQYDEAMNYALGAGKLFDVSHSSEYVDTIVAKCIDQYIKQRVEQIEDKEGNKIEIDKRLENIVLGMFDRCFQHKKYRQALGIALEARRLDKLEQAITSADDVPEMLRYALQVSLDLILHRDFRQNVLRLLVKLYQQLPVPDYLTVCEILIFLDDSKSTAQILSSLLQQSDDSKILIGYQIAFDLVQNGTQQFIQNVITELDTQANNNTEGYADRKQKLKTILTGETTINLFLDFLFRNNNTDTLILKNIKTALENRSSVLHTATIITNALMHCGTTIDTFLRENLEWLSRATNWAKFTAIAGLGAIHKGQVKEALSLLGPYLPQPGSAGSAYSEGGSLYALGLIHANHGKGIIDYLTTALHGANGNEIVQHGACLGLGLAGMASGLQPVYDDLKNILYMDSAVAGEAAGIGMGLVMLGTANSQAVEEMLIYAHETQHEKIIRGLALGIALVMYSREEQADTLIEQLLLDKDPILRYGAMYTIGLAYCGTANNSAIKRLLHVAVSDVSDDVRRAAVTALGFVLFKQPEQCPKVVSLLAESYNPHVRYGACLALGISCAGTALKGAIDILEPLASDSVDFVRQGALIGLSMVLIQATKQQEPKVEQIRKLIDEKITDKHEEQTAKFGAVLAAGILDAGGRNVTISLSSRSGHKNLSAIVGLAIFTQFWYWYPLTYFVSLAFTPTAFVGLSKDLKMPVFQFKSNVRPSVFAYPPKITPPSTAAPAKVQTAVLSTTRKKKKQDEKKKEAMDIEPQKSEETPKEEKKEEEKEKEPDFEIKNNPARVTRAQVKHLSFDVSDRYTPVRSSHVSGIVMLNDNKPGQPEELVTAASSTTQAPAASSTAATTSQQDNEPAPPEPFQYDPTKA